MELKVKEVVKVEKSQAQVEEELLKQNEEKQAALEEAAEQPAEQTEAVSEPVQEEKKELDDQTVLDYIRKRYDKPIESFDDLMAKRESEEELPEDVAAYFKYKKETGRGIEDYAKLNRDFDELNPDTLLAEYYLANEEAIDSEDVEALLDDFTYDEEVDEEKVIKKRKLAKKREIVKAKKFFNEQKDKYKQPLESRTDVVSEKAQKELEEYRQYIDDAKTQKEVQQKKYDWFAKKTDEVFSNEFKGFEFKLGENSVMYNPGDVNELKKSQSNIMNFVQKYLGEDGLMKDATGYHKALSLAMNPEKFAQFFYEQGKAEAIESDARKTKNINMNLRSAPEVVSKGGMKMRTVNNDSGNRLRIKSSRFKN
jgi:hypothetical protein|tara:strand:+ start:2017 stop:3117 length:1101 start_codon:yes stop_codon:yes gene_type:complete